MPRIGNAPSGEKAVLDGTEKLPITGSQYALISSIKNYVKTVTDTLYSAFNHSHADSDNGGAVNHTVLTNAGTSLHVPTYSSDSTEYLNGKGEWATPAGLGNVYDSDVIMQDITTNDADSDNHGFLLKLSMDTAKFLRADGSWQTPPAGGSVYDSDILFSDITTNNADSDQHGFLPKLSGDSTEYLNGNGEWAIPPGTAGGLSNSSVSPTSDDITASVNTRYFATISGLNNDINFKLPSGAAGNEIELNVIVGDDAYEVIVKGDTGIKINGGSAATEWSRLFISGESVRLIAIDSDDWQVIHDGRIPCEGKMTLSGADTTNTAATDTLPTWDTKVIDQGNLGDTTNYRFNLRRAGNYMAGGGAYPNGTLTDGNYYYVTIKQGSTAIAGGISRASGNTNISASAVTEFVGAVGDAIYLYYTPQATNMGIANNQYSQFWIKEI